MDINFTPQQFKTLLRLIYLGRWMLTAHSNKPDKVIDSLASHIYSFAKSAGVDNLVELEREDGLIYPTREFEDRMTEPIRDYDNETFWEELIDRLASRDFLAKYGEQAIQKMSMEERFTNFQEFEDRYGEEFEDHGIERIAISDSKT